MSRDLVDIQLACFNLGDSLFAVDIMRIREIIPSQKLAGLPGPSRFLDGVINLRGTVIPVMNLRRRFNMPPLPVGTPSKLLLVTLPRQVLALAVDDVLEVMTVPVANIKPSPEVDDTVGVECILGVCLVEKNVFMILDIDSLVGTCDVMDTVRSNVSC